MNRRIALAVIAAATPFGLTAAVDGAVARDASIDFVNNTPETVEILLKAGDGAIWRQRSDPRSTSHVKLRVSEILAILFQQGNPRHQSAYYVRLPATGSGMLGLHFVLQLVRERQVGIAVASTKTGAMLPIDQMSIQHFEALPPNK